MERLRVGAAHRLRRSRTQRRPPAPRIHQGGERRPFHAAAQQDRAGTRRSGAGKLERLADRRGIPNSSRRLAGAGDRHLRDAEFRAAARAFARRRVVLFRGAVLRRCDRVGVRRRHGLRAGSVPLFAIAAPSARAVVLARSLVADGVEMGRHRAGRAAGIGAVLVWHRRGAAGRISDGLLRGDLLPARAAGRARDLRAHTRRWPAAFRDRLHRRGGGRLCADESGHVGVSLGARPESRCARAPIPMARDLWAERDESLRSAAVAPLGDLWQLRQPARCRARAG